MSGQETAVIAITLWGTVLLLELIGEITCCWLRFYYPLCNVLLFKMFMLQENW